MQLYHNQELANALLEASNNLVPPEFLIPEARVMPMSGTRGFVTVSRSLDNLINGPTSGFQPYDQVQLEIPKRHQRTGMPSIITSILSTGPEMHLGTRLDEHDTVRDLDITPEMFNRTLLKAGEIALIHVQNRPDHTKSVGISDPRDTREYAGILLQFLSEPQ